MIRVGFILSAFIVALSCATPWEMPVTPAAPPQPPTLPTLVRIAPPADRHPALPLLADPRALRPAAPALAVPIIPSIAAMPTQPVARVPADRAGAVGDLAAATDLLVQYLKRARGPIASPPVPYTGHEK